MIKTICAFADAKEIQSMKVWSTDGKWALSHSEKRPKCDQIIFQMNYWTIVGDRDPDSMFLHEYKKVNNNTQIRTWKYMIKHCAIYT
jgi:hypothetical protein